MKAYSVDLRRRVLDGLDAGMTQREAADIFSISLATVGRLVRQWRATGSIEPQPLLGRRPRLGEAQGELLGAQLHARPDATLEEHCELLKQEQGVVQSVSALSRTLERLKWTRKKRV